MLCAILTTVRGSKFMVEIVAYDDTSSVRGAV